MRIDISQKPNIDSRVKNIIIEKLGFNESEIVNNASFTNNLGIDSLDLYEVFMEFEKEFGITIPDEEAEKLTTVDSVINYVKRANATN